MQTTKSLVAALALVTFAASSATAQTLHSPASTGCVPAGYGNTTALSFAYGIYDGFGPGATFVDCIRGWSTGGYSDLPGGFWGGASAGTYVARIDVMANDPLASVFLEAIKLGSWTSADRPYSARVTDLLTGDNHTFIGSVAGTHFTAGPFFFGGNKIRIEWGGTDDGNAWWLGADDLSFRVVGGTTTVPEPQTIVLLGTGLCLVGLGALRRRA